MTYQETISFLFSQLPVYQRDGEKAIKKDLSNIIKLCEALDNPHLAWPSIHIAGTNGKGTVTHMVAAGFQAAGFKVGVYSSPHYIDFRERIKINGDWISESAVVSFVQEHQTLIEEIQPSFFEITVAMAFDYFRSEKVDIAIIETGLGGRLDSTNVITPLLSIITNIGLDHMNMLGNSIYEIAYEKAGIIKPDIPVIIGLHQAECDAVFINKAKQTKSDIVFASLGEGSDRTEKVDAAKSPFYQENRQTASTALTYLSWHGIIDIGSEHISAGLQEFETLTNYMGRWQILGDRPLIIADSAHNIDAISKVLEKLQTISRERLHMVLGFVKEKDLSGVLSLLPKDAHYYLVKPDIFRGIAVGDLAKLFDGHDLNYTLGETVSSGYSVALEAAGEKDLIYVGGSSFVVGDLLSYLANS